jgi:hypothetical protein
MAGHDLAALREASQCVHGRRLLARIEMLARTPDGPARDSLAPARISRERIAGVDFENALEAAFATPEQALVHADSRAGVRGNDRNPLTDCG